MGFRERLQKLMDAKNMKPRELWRLCEDGVSLAWIYKALDGQIESVGVEKVHIVARALKVDPSELLHEKGAETPFKQRLKKLEKELEGRPVLDKKIQQVVDKLQNMTEEEQLRAIKLLDISFPDAVSVKTQKKIS